MYRMRDGCQANRQGAAAPAAVPAAAPQSTRCTVNPVRLTTFLKAKNN